MKRRAPLLALLALAAGMGAGAAVSALRTRAVVPQEDYYGFAQRLYGREFEPQAARGGLYPAFLALCGVPAGRLTPEAARLGQVLLAVVVVLGAAGLAGSAGGLPAAAFAAGGLLCDAAFRESALSLNVYFFYGFCVLCLAAAAAPWFEKPEIGRSALVGALCGLVLACRSALLSAPILLGSAVLLLPRFKGKRTRVLAAAFAGLAAVLAPWTIRNWIFYRRVIPLEDATWIPNAMAAGLGRETPMEFAEVEDRGRAARPDFDRLPPAERAGFLHALIRRDVAAAPGRFLLGCVRRVVRLWSDSALLLLLAGLCFLRPSPGAAVLALLLASFNIYALVGVRSFYADSARPLLWVLAARGAFPGSPVPWPRWTTRALLACAASIFVFYCACLADEVRGLGAGRADLPLAELKPDPASLERLDAALRDSPRNFRYWNARGVLRYLSGSAGPAREDFRRALELNPRFTDAYLDLGAADEALGDREGARAAYERGLSSLSPDAPAEQRAALIEANDKLGP